MFQTHDPEMPPPDAELRVAVVIPARDEADHLPATLRSFARQRDRRGSPLDRRAFEVIVLANNCTDATADLARGLADELARDATIRVVERRFAPPEAHIGTARKWLMDRACDRLEAVGRPAGLIATTDADTRVGPHWLAASLAEAADGADAVAGLIRVDPRELRELAPRVRRAYWLDQVHRRLQLEMEALLDPNPLDPPPRHDFHGGASLAITPAMYRRVGGLPPLACHEDVALAAALWRVDARFVHSRRVRVRTSSRLLGRAAGGQSQALARWATDQEALVADARGVEAELVARRRLRRVFATRPAANPAGWRPEVDAAAGLAETLRVDRDELAAAMARLGTFGAWLEAIRELQAAAGLGEAPRQVPLGAAIDHLRHRVQALRRGHG